MCLPSLLLLDEQSELQVLASIGQLEFFYDQAPDVMRSCSMALQLLSVAAGSYLSGTPCYAFTFTLCSTGTCVLA